jgi:hypothetical protein
VQILLHSLDGPLRPFSLSQHDSIACLYVALCQAAIVPTSSTQFVCVRREVFELKSVVELVAWLTWKADLEYSPSLSDCEDVADANVPLVHVLKDKILAEAARCESIGRCRKLGFPRWIVRSAV